MLGEPLAYWLVFALAALLFCAPWASSRWEARQDRRDRELWRSMGGGRL